MEPRIFQLGYFKNSRKGKGKLLCFINETEKYHHCHYRADLLAWHFIDNSYGTMEDDISIETKSLINLFLLNNLFSASFLKESIVFLDFMLIIVAESSYRSNDFSKFENKFEFSITYKPKKNER